MTKSNRSGILLCHELMFRDPQPSKIRREYSMSSTSFWF